MLDAVPRPPESRPRRRPRLHLPARTVLLGGLLLVLAVGCAVALRVRPGSGSASGTGGRRGHRPRRAPVTARSTTTAPAVRPFTATVGDTTGCQTLAAAAPQLLCPIPDGTVTYTQVTDLASRYRSGRGHRRPRGRTGRCRVRSRPRRRAGMVAPRHAGAGRGPLPLPGRPDPRRDVVDGRRCRRARGRDTCRW